MDIFEIAERINGLSSGYNIGKLQSIRKEIKLLKIRPGSKIFSNKTIFKGGWAFHHGGLKELQFNIGFEKEGFRYGIAFSLEPTQSQPDISDLYPKIRKLNCIIREHPEYFSDYIMLYSYNNRREIHSVNVIPSDRISPQTFIFIGKIDNVENLNYKNILSVLDDLLKIYIEVESDHSYIAFDNGVSDKNEFIFNSNNPKITTHKEYRTVEREIDVDIRHSLLQIALSDELIAIYGNENVSVENPFLGNRIDIVLKTDTEFHFYEVKVASSAKACIRQAVGQLLEYAYWPGKKHAHKIVVVGEHILEKEAAGYLLFLQNEFHLPIEYKQITI